ncbi:MAG: membrane protein insertion efficiency factor YidD [Planctomycetes bacterium]|nr:membrane protein insertion efficiency factor YidD [Planctomycetota bacterium]
MTTGFARLARLPALALIGLIRVYQATLSKVMPPVCRFQPTCSRYCAEALQKRGFWVGGWLGARRLLRCQPWGGSGYDPVPEASSPKSTRV